MYEIKATKLDNEYGNLIGLASIVVDGKMKFDSIRILKNNSERGFFVAMPSYRDKYGEYHDMYMPVTSEMTYQIMDAVEASLLNGMPAVINEGKQERLRVSVKQSRSEDTGIVANVRLTIGDMTCPIIQVRQSPKDRNLYIAMPGYKTRDNEYKQVCHPITADFRRELHNDIYLKYDFSRGNGKPIRNEMPEKQQIQGRGR